MSWIRGILIAIDQLGNALAGGNPDSTVSARVGHFARKQNNILHFYWKTMEAVINHTFYPIHGPDHCYKSHLADRDEKNIAGSDTMRAILGLIIIASCPPFYIFIRAYVLVSPGAKFITSDK
ncbi:hypothetical protein MNBD_GAMMA11-138 [hydrothermal vent metagenome]|uniref:Uncharacterized protein n=1 Tax=hydrothermal vent metagenome TaxID=652676 RepID=A0A3B0XP48_9ZZZZ